MEYTALKNVRLPVSRIILGTAFSPMNQGEAVDEVEAGDAAEKAAADGHRLRARAEERNQMSARGDHQRGHSE